MIKPLTVNKTCWVTRERNLWLPGAGYAPVSWINNRACEPMQTCEQPTGCKQEVPASAPIAAFRTLAVTGAVGGFHTGRTDRERTSTQTEDWRQSSSISRLQENTQSCGSARKEVTRSKVSDPPDKSRGERFHLLLTSVCSCSLWKPAFTWLTQAGGQQTLSQDDWEPSQNKQRTTLAKAAGKPTGQPTWI